MLRALAFCVPLVATGVAAQDRPVIATVNYPLAYFAERLGGDAIVVLFPVPEGRDPALWRPGIQEIAAIQAADLIALNGAGFADWTTRASLPRSRLVDTSAPFSDNYIATDGVTHSHGPEGEHSHTGTTSFTWLDFEQAVVQAETLAGAMKRAIPELADQVNENLTGLTEDLRALDATAAEIGRALSDKTLITSHPRYQYFARAYELRTVALEWEPGTLPTEEQWQQMEEVAENAGVSGFLWEAEPPDAAWARVENMGLEQIVFPTLAHRPADGDLIENLREALDDLAEAGAGG